MMSNFYNEMMTRNWAYITEEEQEKIKNTKILLAGCGLGSTIAELAVEIGFTKFVLVDGDKVEVSNLNRQSFDRRHVGQNKAEALKQILEEKSEAVEAEVYPEMITSETAKSFVLKGDIVINLVDFNEAFYVLNDVAREQDKLSITSLNIGWIEGFSLAFSSKSPSVEEMIGERIIDDEGKFFEKFTRSIQGYTFPDSFMQNLEWIMKTRREKGYNPQIGTGAASTAITVVFTMTRYILGLPIVFAPGVITIQNLYNLKEERK